LLILIEHAIKNADFCKKNVFPRTIRKHLFKKFIGTPHKQGLRMKQAGGNILSGRKLFFSGGSYEY